MLGVGAGQRRIAVGMHRAEHMVVDLQPAVAEALGRLGEVADDRRVRADLRGREYHPEIHRFLLLARGAAVGLTRPGGGPGRWPAGPAGWPWPASGPPPRAAAGRARRKGLPPTAVL